MKNIRLDEIAATGAGTCAVCRDGFSQGDKVRKVSDDKSPQGLYCHAGHGKEEIAAALSKPRCKVFGCGVPLSPYNATGKCAAHSR